jgi:hypothetical protein
MIVRIIELAAAAIIVIILATQVVAPLWTGRRLFPLFRARKAEGRLIDARERAEERGIERAAEEIEQELSAPAADPALATAGSASVVTRAPVPPAPPTPTASPPGRQTKRQKS